MQYFCFGMGKTLGSVSNIPGLYSEFVLLINNNRCEHSCHYFYTTSARHYWHQDLIHITAMCNIYALGSQYVWALPGSTFFSFWFTDYKALAVPGTALDAGELTVQLVKSQNQGTGHGTKLDPLEVYYIYINFISA